MGSKTRIKNRPLKGQKPVKHGKHPHKKWKRGHSAISNPETTRFREAAKGRFFTKNTGPSTLTVDALQKHDKDQDSQSMSVDSDQQTLGTFKTWASNWTDCTNATFSKVHRYWASNSALHKEILAVLAAITEVIKTEGGNETETEYFAALMTALENADTPESQTAIMYLLSLVIKKVPVPVVRSKFSEVAKIFLDLLAKNTDDEQASLPKSVLMALAYLLRFQEKAVWANTSVQQVYRGLLTFVTHKKPKVRKAAHTGVNIVLKGSLFMTEGDSPTHHPAAAMTAKHCVQIIEECGGIGDAKDTLHVLHLLQSILSVLPRNSLKTTCEAILRVMTLSNVVLACPLAGFDTKRSMGVRDSLFTSLDSFHLQFVKASGMQALHSMFAAKPKESSLSAELNAQIITALYDYQPGENDVQPTLAWLAVMEMAHINLTGLDPNLCLSHLPKLFSAGMVCLLSVKTEITNAACKTMKSILQNCVLPVAEELRTSIETSTTSNPSQIHKIVKALESGLSYQFHVSWGLVLQLFAMAYQALGKHYPQLFVKSLKTIADLRDSVRFQFKGELDTTVGWAIKMMGPQHVLNAVPLQITGQCDDLDFPRSWLIPVMRDNIMDTELGFFTSYFLPLAAKLRQRVLELSDQQNMVASKTYDILQYQIWSLLPGFCTRPTDIAQSFKGIAKVLGTAISDRPDLRLEVMSSLRKLIVQSLTCDETRKEISRFAKNFLPILFNLYTTDTDKDKTTSRLAVFETIKSYFQITDKQLMSTYCDKCKEKLSEENITAQRKHYLYDLFVAMIPYLSSQHLEWMYNLALEHLKDTDQTLQKKCYRILEDICAGKSPESRELVLEKLPDIQIKLLSSISASAPSSKAPRLRCIINVFKFLETENNKFLLASVPEAILCTKEVGERARMVAFSLLTEMGNAVIRWADGDQGPLDEYFKMVMAGFAGSPQMISATLFSLTRIMFEFKDQLSSTTLQSIIENCCLLLKSKSREIVQSALSFLKVLIKAYPVTTLAQYLQDIVKSLISMKEDCHHHFRFKSKEIYSKLIKKFGYDTIYGMVPDSIRKVLVNIRKTQEREKRKKKGQEIDEDSDEEGPMFKSKVDSIEDILKDSDSEPEDEQEENKKKKKSKKELREARAARKTGQSWLVEGGEDDIMDFMDVKASQKVTATKPVQKQSRKSDSGFKTAPDGRLIIADMKDDKGDSSDENIDDLLEHLEQRREGRKIKQKKRKFEDLGDSDDDQPSTSQYVAGGKGIHRPLKNKKQQQAEDYGAEYRAKKAKGDVKKAGKPDPYAYVPLDFKHLNKRKQAKFKGRFKNLVKGAQRGAAKGMKKGKRKQ